MPAVGSDLSRFPLFETVHFEAVSSNGIRDFTKFLLPGFECLTLPLWERLCRRLICEAKPLLELFDLHRFRFSGRIGRCIDANPERLFDGII
jgi:hypothetical protein